MLMLNNANAKHCLQMLSYVDLSKQPEELPVPRAAVAYGRQLEINISFGTFFTAFS